MKTNLKILALVIIALLLTTSVYAEEKPAKRKIGYIDIIRVGNEYDKAQEGYVQLEKKAEKKNKEKEKLVNQLNKLREESELLRSGEREKKRTVIEDKFKDLQDFNRAAGEELRREKDSLERDILIDISKSVTAYGEARNYDFILDARALFYGGEEADISNEIIKDLNKKR